MLADGNGSEKVQEQRHLDTDLKRVAPLDLREWTVSHGLSTYMHRKVLLTRTVRTAAVAAHEREREPICRGISHCQIRCPCPTPTAGFLTNSAGL
jgi:hypothetical protein